METPPTMRRVVIVGSGIVGLSSALALLQLRDIPLSIVIHERRSKEKALAGYGGIMLQENGVKALRALAYSGDELFETLKAAGRPIGNGGFLTRRGKSLFYSEQRTRAEAAASDQFGIAIIRSRLQKLLFSAIEKAAESAPLTSFKICWNSNLIDMKVDREHSEATVYFEDGSSEVADLLIGADGINSSVRRSLSGDKCLDPLHYSGQTCWFGIVPGELRREAKEELAKFETAEYWGERRSRFGYFPASSNELCWYAIAAAERGQKDTENVKDVLRAVYCQQDYKFPPVVEAIINNVSNNSVYRQDICDRDALSSQWGNGVVTLCGDAAHPMHPSLGQGACVGIEDVVELVARVGAAWRSGKQLEKALRQYEMSRTARVSRFQATARQVSNISSVTNPVICFLRDIVFQIMPQSAADKQLLWMYSEYRPTLVL